MFLPSNWATFKSFPNFNLMNEYRGVFNLFQDHGNKYHFNYSPL